MTEDMWYSLPAVAVDANCGTPADTQLDVAAGQTIVICPNPAQKWRHDVTDNLTNYLGLGQNSKVGYSTARAIVNNTPERYDLTSSIIVEFKNAGRLFVGSQAPAGRKGEGVISFKIFRVQDR